MESLHIYVIRAIALVSGIGMLWCMYQEMRLRSESHDQAKVWHKWGIACFGITVSCLILDSKFGPGMGG